MPKPREQFRFKNVSPERAARILLAAREHVMREAREWAQHPGDVSVAADVGSLLNLLASKVRLGTDVIQA